jgi:hypothetical protein
MAFKLSNEILVTGPATHTILRLAALSNSPVPEISSAFNDRSIAFSALRVPHRVAEAILLASPHRTGRKRKTFSFGAALTPPSLPKRKTLSPPSLADGGREAEGTVTARMR